MRERMNQKLAKRMGAAMLLLAVSTAAVVVPFLDRELPTATQLVASDATRTGTGHNHAFCALLGATPSLIAPVAESTLPSAPGRMCAPVETVAFAPQPSPTRRWHQRAPPRA